MSTLYDYIIGTQSGTIATILLTQRDENDEPKFWAEDVDDFLRKEGHDMFKTINISGFISFLLYVGIVGFFALIGFFSAHFCCSPYKPEEKAQNIVDELKDIADSKN